MSGHSHGDGMRGYSTELAYRNSKGGLTTDGYSVEITPAQLEKAVGPLKEKLAGQGLLALTGSLRKATGVTGSFGSIPNGGKVEAEVISFIEAHLQAMQTMGISLTDFVANVQAAAQIGHEADPATRAAAARADMGHRMEMR